MSTAVLRTTGRIGKIDVDYQIEGRAVLMPKYFSICSDI